MRNQQGNDGAMGEDGGPRHRLSFEAIIEHTKPKVRAITMQLCDSNTRQYASTFSGESPRRAPTQ